MFCTNCGNKLNQNDKFCNLCGTQNIVDQSNQEIESNIIDNEMNLTNQESDNLVVNIEKENKHEEKKIRTEKPEIAKIKNTSVLKILSFISIAVFFLPIYSDWGWLFSILHSKEPTAVSVPIFTFSLILFIGILTNIGTEKGIFKTSSILGAVNWLLSLFLIIPTPLHTQVNCLGSYVIFIVNLSVFIYGLINFLTKRNIEYENKVSYTIEQQKSNNEIYKKTFSHRIILKLLTLCALVAFVLPCALTSCDINDTSNNLNIETGIDIMSHFSNGIGNSFAITVFVLFIAILLSLFIKRKPFIYFPFLIGTTNVFMLVMTKLVFYKNIKSYLVGSYIMFIASIIISALGYIYYKKVTANDIAEDFNIYPNIYSNDAELQRSVINSGEGQSKEKRSIKRRQKLILIPVLAIAIVTISVGGVNLYNKNKEEKRIEGIKEIFRPENLRGLWNVQGEDFNLLFYSDNDLKMHIRSSYGFDPNGNKPMVDVEATGLGNGIIDGLTSTNGNTTAITLRVKDKDFNSYTMHLSFSDMKNGFKRMYDKDVVITRSNISFNSSNKKKLTDNTTELLADKFKEYKGQQWVPISIDFDETNKTDGIISAGQVAGKAVIVNVLKPGVVGRETLKVSFSMEVVTKSFQFRELIEGGNYIIHNYKTQ